MFDRILIKSESKQAKRFLSIADLVDMLFYYGEVHVIVSQFELQQLLDTFGEDVLFELVSSKRLLVHPCGQHIGASSYGTLESVGLFSHNFKTIDELLYNYHKRIIDDTQENSRFAEKFSKVLEEYKFPTGFQASLYKDIENADLLSRATQVFIKQYYPSYKNIDEIRVDAHSAENTFMNFYKIESNLRMDELNVLHRQSQYDGAFTYSTMLMSLGETHADCFTATDLQSELIANQRWSEIYKLRMNESISQAEGSKVQIDHFREMTVNDYLSPGMAFVEGRLDSYELLKDIMSWDTYNFRKWLSAIPTDRSLISEMYKDIQSQNSNKVWIKCFRTIIQLVAGALSPFAGSGLTLLDGLIGDKLVNGWRPTIFVNNMLAKREYKDTVSSQCIA